MTDQTSPPLVVPGRHLFHSHVPYHDTRNPVRPSGRGFRAKFASSKMRRMVRCESLLEMNCLYLAEFARSIATFDEQPVSISYRLNGRSRRYTPDFKFYWEDGREWYIEVKPAERLHTIENQERFAEIALHFERWGARFVVLTEQQLCHQHRLPQIKYLHHRKAGNGSRCDLATLAQWQTCDEVNFAEAESLLGGRQALIQALARRDLVCDLTTPIVDGTHIRLYREADDGALFL
ncbi:TnsA endonuclease N-terminal domain-containing protein [Cupriavidus sp. M-11]|uniref:TnsA endonuclease N-terminal domain-containing protein n=1 Tax=Cupriavidus sp. M-11 TaxID=3233038 RepID=UPI003F8F062C